MLNDVKCVRPARYRRAFASGVINAGGSLGQFLMAPLVQIMISTWGWAIALWGLATAAGRTSAREELGRAFRNRSYLCLHLGFFTCGFHIAFLVTHLPSEIALCGLPSQAAGVALGLIGLFNIAGSILIGWLAGRYRMKILLAELYAIRAAVILIYRFAPKTVTTLYVQDCHRQATGAILALAE